LFELRGELQKRRLVAVAPNVVRADLLLVPPDTLHAHPAFGASAVLYLEPESIEWARFAGRESTGLASLPFDPRLRSFARCAATGDSPTPLIYRAPFAPRSALPRPSCSSLAA
jgi:hypothetical protein